MKEYSLSTVDINCVPIFQRILKFRQRVIYFFYYLISGTATPATYASIYLSPRYCLVCVSLFSFATYTNLLLVYIVCKVEELADCSIFFDLKKGGIFSWSFFCYRVEFIFNPHHLIKKLAITKCLRNAGRNAMKS